MRLADEVTKLLIEGGIPRTAISTSLIRKGVILTVKDKDLVIPTIIPDEPPSGPQWSADAVAGDILSLWRQGPPKEEI